MQLFYFGEANLKTLFNAGMKDISLTGDEAAHLKVLRLRAGEKIKLTDGLGHLCTGEIIESSHKSNLIALTDLTTYIQPKHYAHIAVAPTKNLTRFEWFLEKATEFGISEITPFYSEHSERINLRLDRLDKVIISAMKQSNKFFKPQINQPTDLNTLIMSSGNQGNCFIAWLDKINTLPHLKSACKKNIPATVLIGPEGDFSPSEVQIVKDHGFIPVSLGSSRLRTETAALSACFIVNLINEPDEIHYSNLE